MHTHSWRGLNCSLDVGYWQSLGGSNEKLEMVLALPYSAGTWYRFIVARVFQNILFCALLPQFLPPTIAPQVTLSLVIKISQNVIFKKYSSGRGSRDLFVKSSQVERVILTCAERRCMLPCFRICIGGSSAIGAESFLSAAMLLIP